MNISDILILAAIGIAVVLGVRRMRGRKNRGCGCGCDSCPGCGQKKN